MLTWSPNCRLYINETDAGSGTNLNTGILLEGVSITHGRSDIDDTIRAGYASFSFIYDDYNFLPFPLNTNHVRITIENSTGTEVTLFDGIMTEYRKSWENYNPASPTEAVAKYEVTAISNLGLLARQILPSVSFNQELEADRIELVIYETIGQYLTWNDLSGTWNDLVGTWNTIGVYEGDAGVFELQAEGSSDWNAYDVVANAASSGAGLFVERKNGTFYFENAHYRYNKYSTFAYDLQPNVQQALSKLSLLYQKWKNINRAVVVYSGGASVFAENTTAINDDGLLARQWDTTLKHVADATTQANFYLAARDDNEKSLDSVTWLLNNLPSNAMLDGFLASEISDLWGISGWPSTIIKGAVSPSGGAFIGFLEGFTININRVTATFTATLSPAASTSYNF